MLGKREEPTPVHETPSVRCVFAYDGAAGVTPTPHRETVRTVGEGTDPRVDEMATTRSRGHRRGLAAAMSMTVAMVFTGCDGAPTTRPQAVNPTASTPPPIATQPPGHASWAPWPSALHDARHSGSSTFAGPTAGKLRWRRHLEGAVTPGPVIGPDGTIYAASNGGVLHALDPATGADRWTYDCGTTGGRDDLSVSPLVLPDATILWPTPGHRLLALSPAGTLSWSVSLPGHPTSPASVDGNRVYVGDITGTVTALDVAGKKPPRTAWTVKVGAVSYGSVVVGDNGRLYTTADSSLVAIDDHGTTASVAWTADPDDDITEVSPGLAPDGTALLGTNGRSEWAYHPDGTLAWHSPRIITYSSPTVTDGGLAFVADHSGTVHLLNTNDGTETSTYRASTAQIWSAVVVDDTYRAYFGTQTGHAIGVDAHGGTMFDVDLGAPVDSYPALTADATLIIGDRNGTLSAIT
jgi:outer membrane protein assembly factor BamB